MTNILFKYYKDDGEEAQFVSDAIILSTSCNIDQKSKIIMAPVLPLKTFRGNVNSLKKNTIFDYMYIEDTKLKDYFVDFSIMNSNSKKRIFTGIDMKNINRKAYLNQLAYYFFIIKLTIYFMRKEDSETLEKRLITMDL